MDTSQKAAFYEFIREYLDGALDLFEKDQPTSDFSRGYQKALLSLKGILDKMESSDLGKAA